MKQYPHIPHGLIKSIDFHVFAKYDGSQIRAEWNSKSDFFKFGTRNRLLGPNEMPLGEAVEIINTKYKKALNDIFSKNRVTNAVCYFEFFGPSSFAGNHCEELHDVILFDVSIYKQGFIPPNEFVKMFSSVDIPPVLYFGKLNSILEDKVSKSTLEGMPFEGVVAKAKNPNHKQHDNLMCKLKSRAWLEKLKGFCGSDSAKFNELR